MLRRQTRLMSMPMKTRSLFFGLCLVLAMPVSESTSQDLHPGIIGEDDRIRVLEEGPPWDAIGQVNIGGQRLRGACSGTLVAPEIVVTAAHCVINPWSRVPFPLRDIHFVAGVRGAVNKGHSTAKCLRFPDDYEFVSPDIIQRAKPTETSLAFFENDTVAIVLNEPLSILPAPLAEQVAAEPGLRLVHGSYPADRRFSLTAHFECQLLRADLEGGIWFNDCDTHGSSWGGPLFTRTDGTLRLAAVMLGTGERLSNLALPISKWKDLIANASCP